MNPKKHNPQQAEFSNKRVTRTRAKTNLFLSVNFLEANLDIARGNPELFVFSLATFCMEYIVIFGRDRGETKLRHQSTGERINNRPREPAIQSN